MEISIYVNCVFK